MLLSTTSFADCSSTHIQCIFAGGNPSTTISEGYCWSWKHVSCRPCRNYQSVFQQCSNWAKSLENPTCFNSIGVYKNANLQGIMSCSYCDNGECKSW